jgi:hypothetical protein
MSSTNRVADIAGDAPPRPMGRLQAELQRLYPTPEPGRDDQLRTFVLELARPASWVELAKAWQGVQADLGLPAPAIAVSGSDGCQLWFSLSRPVPAAQANWFVEAVRKRYLADLDPRRVSLQPGRVLPPVEAAPGHWSAFVTPDLAALFADEPWLDLPPSADAQADLLSRIQPAGADDWQRALSQLQPPAPPPAATAPEPERAKAAPAPSLDPRQFLLDAMNDPALDMHLRIEAAKALLPSFDPRRGA